MADQEDQSSRTEQPTDRKLQKAKEEGNVAKSKEVNHLFGLLAMLLALFLTVPFLTKQLFVLFGTVFSELGSWRAGSVDQAGEVAQTLGTEALWALIPTLIILLILGLFGGFVQNGIIFSTKPVEPKLDKISLLKGFKRMFSLKSLAEFLKAILKMVLVGGALYLVLQAHWPAFFTLPEKTPFDGVITVKIIIERLIMMAIAIMAILAAADFIFQRYQFREEQKMSRKEIKDEMKETEGDPHIKARQRQLRAERARQRMMQEVPKADVVITNPTHFAIALQYDPDGGRAAPLVVAKGADHIALKIREIAQEHGVPLYEDPPLARQLYQTVELDEEVPVQLYEAVAKVIAYILNLKKKG